MINPVGPKRTPGTEGIGSGPTPPQITWRKLLSRSVDLARPGALKEAQEILAPVFAAGKAAFGKISLEKALELAKVTHNAYFEGADKPIIADPKTIFVDPNKITPENAAQLKALLTPEGETEVDKFVSGEHVGKAFLLPAHILPGNVAAFLKFFGKTDPKAIADLQALVDSGNSKKKVANNQAMDWDTMMKRIDTIYKGSKIAEMKQYEAGLQAEAILDSAIAIALQQHGVIPTFPVGRIYEAYHVLWATHNDWQDQAKVNYENLDAQFGVGTAIKDNVILDAHMALAASLKRVIDAVLAA